VSDTPETDAMCICTHHKSFAATGGVVNPDFARRLEIERDELRSDLEFRRGLFKLQEQQLNDVRAERDKWKAKFIQQNKDLGCEMMDPAGTIWDYAKKLQDENEALQEQLNFERDVNKHKAVADAISIGEAAGKSAQDQIEALQEQLDAAIMLGKMAMRKFIRELELERLKQQQQ
jgi:hypothetical protein